MNSRPRRFRTLLPLLVALIGCAAAPSAAHAIVPPGQAFQAFHEGGFLYLPGANLVAGSAADDAFVDITLPFDVKVHGHTFPSGTTVRATTNGVLEFGAPSASTSFSNTALPSATYSGTTMFPHWDDLTGVPAAAPNLGIYTATYSAFNAFVIEWRMREHDDTSKVANFEVILTPDASGGAIYSYQTVDEGGSGATVGLQDAAGGQAPTQYEFNQPGSLTSPDGVVIGPSSPNVSGTAQVGETQTVDATGVFTGTPPLALSYQWHRCPPSSSCTDIPGATGSAYVATDADAGDDLGADVTATNSGGSATVASETTSKIADSPPPAPAYTLDPLAPTTFVPATTSLGSSVDDGVTNLALPFPINVYGHAYSMARAGSNGSLEFGSPGDATSHTAGCLPDSLGLDVVQVLQGDFQTTGAGHGIFTSVTGAAPHRTFVVEWRVAYHANPAKSASFELLLREGSPVMTAVYGASDGGISGTVIGIQHSIGHPFSQFICGLSTPPVNSTLAFDESRPSISGGIVIAQTIHASHATWTGEGPLDFTDVWKRCDAEGANCVTTGAGESYTLTAADVGHRMIVRELADGPTGSAAVSSDPSGIVNAGPPPRPDRTVPKLTSLKGSPASYRAGATAKLSFRLSEPASVLFHVQRVASGRRSGKKCVKLTRSNRRKPRCALVTTLKGSFTVKGKVGVNSLTYKGTLNRKKLATGSYRLVGTPTDAAKNKGKSLTLSFRILAPRKPRKT